MAVKVTADNFQSALAAGGVPVLVDFYSEGCVPCRRMSPVLAELEEEYDGRVKLIKVNVAAGTALTDKYEILAAPTLVFFMNGQERARLSGVNGKGVLRGIIDKILEESK
ncbi:thioredoxin [Sporobacter termitidis DSM 10068]|uniref:Thioredoxin n=1 Tax=Sporobacter termitidis DSM 10068 TaxID=1123282 RepID=A0A1M5UT44_9FIRM|nr:thioredoxin domain-containing protein [Sporobacter termitidis]SHH66217.1 thioredoxin [Sporobacter termitidis DSM 10068]